MLARRHRGLEMLERRLLHRGELLPEHWPFDLHLVHEVRLRTGSLTRSECLPARGVRLGLVGVEASATPLGHSVPPTVHDAAPAEPPAPAVPALPA